FGMLWVIVLLFLLLVVSFAGLAQADPQVECGSTPTDGCVVTTDTTFTPGTYILPNGISLGANDVTVDCNGATLRGSFSVSAAGIFMDSKSGNTIKNCVIEFYDADDFSTALQIISSDNNIIENNVIQFNRHGAWLMLGSSSNEIKNNNIKFNNGDGIKLQGVSGNDVYQNNLIDNVNQVSDTETNNWDGGDYMIGGNYWSDHPCADTEEPYDICDNIYTSGLVTDNFPFEFQDGWDLNRPPIMNTITNKNVNEGQTLQFTVSAVDPNSGDTLSYTVISGPGSMNGNQYLYTPGWDSNHNNENYGITIEVADVHGGTDNDTFQITVTDVNRAPILTDPEPNLVINVLEGEVAVIYADAIDPEEDEIIYSVSDPQEKTDFVLTVIQSALFEWQTDCNSAGTYEVTVMAEDDMNPPMHDDILVTVIVEEALADSPNCAPMLYPIRDINSNEKTTIVIYPKAIDFEGDPINYSINSTLFTWTGYSWYWIVSTHDSGEYDFTVTADDGQVNPVTEQTVHVSVSNTCRIFNKKLWMWDCDLYYLNPSNHVALK
ncbi:MAG: NosD domain-containing protein, partial [Candidatus Aenigmatarchaeota archaeon]